LTKGASPDYFSAGVKRPYLKCKPKGITESLLILLPSTVRALDLILERGIRTPGESGQIISDNIRAVPGGRNA